MRNLMLAGALALAGVAGIGHNMPPVPSPVSAPQERALLPKRIVDENRHNQKLQQKLRKKKRREYLKRYRRFQRKCLQHGAYHPGKLFKGHRI